ncbi:unnamed protein product [Cyclocybe aegerita]|uniref:Uncharacterized protein n=1 Tax=Cyclocybe aegerita TaxID=1973307 RepID=A0A8S0VS61_CYCAE|nr:unnamed protein product [Cyclocybe aegerita]
MFLDIEAGVTDKEEEEQGELEDKDKHKHEEQIYNDVELYEAVTRHSQLMRTIDDTGEDFWEDILAQVRQQGRSSSVMETFNNQEDMRLQENDMIFEIGCLVGHEESVAFKVLSLATHPTFPQTLAPSIVVRSTIPGCIYTEVDDMTQARALAHRIPELNTNNICPVSLDE